MPTKDWDKIMASIPTPPDSDSEDSLNVVSVQKNAQRVSDALHHLMPNLPSSLAGPLPKGMNSAYQLERDLKATFDHVWEHGERARRVVEAAEATSAKAGEERERGGEQASTAAAFATGGEGEAPTASLPPDGEADGA